MKTRETELKTPLQNRSQLKFDMIVYHQDIYWGNEPLTVVGIRKDLVELQGDYSGGTHGGCQKDWLPLNGVLLYNKV